MANRKTWLAVCLVGLSPTVAHAMKAEPRDRTEDRSNQKDRGQDRTRESPRPSPSEEMTPAAGAILAPQLTISVNTSAGGNQVPATGAEVSVTDIQTGQKTVFVIQAAVKTIDLPAGTYAVSASRNGVTSNTVEVKLESGPQSVSLLINGG